MNDLTPAGVMPVTLVGWVTAIGLLLTLVMQFIQMGRFLQKLETIREDVLELKTTQGIMDQHLDSLSQNLRDLVREWRGADGTNGGKSQLRDHEIRLRVIENRHIGEDAVTLIEREQGQGERRRLRDKLIDHTPEPE
jgi:hypothetical protein